MAHLYPKAPPAFAKDPWAWDYTRDRIEANTGIPYDQWQGKHFAGSAAMYKNVVKKYRAAMVTQTFDMPRECVDCGNTKQHYKDDYICVDCRSAVEAANTYQQAVSTINKPDAMDAIRKQLAESLGHAKKDAAKDAAKSANGPKSTPNSAGAGRAYRPSEAKVSRNYNAMAPLKLKKVISELESNAGDSATRVADKGEDISDHLEAAYRVAQEKGL